MVFTQTIIQNNVVAIGIHTNYHSKQCCCYGIHTNYHSKQCCCYGIHTNYHSKQCCCYGIHKKEWRFRSQRFIWSVLLKYILKFKRPPVTTGRINPRIKHSLLFIFFTCPGFSPSFAIPNKIFFTFNRIKF